MARQVMCITKRGDHYNPHERIQGIGGVVGGVRWWRAEDDAIRDVLADSTAYYVSASGYTVWVIVSERLGRKFLTTQADGVTCDNLLRLPECPR
jgi:hypothetical protein